VQIHHHPSNIINKNLTELSMFTAQTKTLYLTKCYLYISVYVTVCTKQNLGSIRNMLLSNLIFN